MCLSDTAEYWWREPRKEKRVFVHLKGYDCSHFHVIDTSKLLKVDCYACLKHINGDEKLKARLEKERSDFEAHRFRFGKCKCGSPMWERKNYKGEIFLGCSSYPKCKNTMSLNKQNKEV